MPSEGHSPSPAPRAGGRHRKKSAFPTGHLVATVAAAGVVVAVGAPLLNALEVEQAGSPIPDVLPMSFSTDTAPQAVSAFPSLVPSAARMSVPELDRVERADAVRERQRKAAEVEEARVAEQKRKKAEAEAARKAEAEAAKKEAARKKALSSQGWVKPAVGRFTSGFGARWGTTHYGVDIANAIGTPIRAAASGTVIESGPASGFGLWVRVQHNDGSITIYGHINESLVSEGQKVAAGEQIATMGNRGQSTGPHLHFEVWVDGGRKVNPVSWMAERGAPLT
jgi:murein DD-endopeptidase MepM/ murein hydrolase activator NlpD